ncbi:MAG: CdaR family protein [Chloroflexi bacterium]|nr:CdaR family protein [Chloroflexota bacterium]
MLKNSLTRIWSSLGTLLLSFALAFAVWVSAVVAADPSKEQDFPAPLPLQVRNQSSGLILVGDIPTEVLLRLSAPVSLWDRLTGGVDTLKAFVDLSNLGPGEYTLPVQIESELRPFRVVQITPTEVALELAPLAVREFPVKAQIEGAPALGFQAEEVDVDPLNATVSGPSDLIAEVDSLIAILDITDARESISTSVSLQAVDENGVVLGGVTIDPERATVNQAIRQAGGYREVAVKVETIGQPAAGFRVTNISVNPPIVTLFSAQPEIVAGLPGFVSTVALDLTNIEENLQTRLSLALPQGVIVIGEEQNVEVLIGIAPIESSTLLILPVEVIGLANGYEAQLSPQSVNVFLSGPSSILQSLLPDDVRVFVDLSGLQSGTHLLETRVEILPEDVHLLTTTPSSIEVTIARSTTP